MSWGTEKYIQHIVGNLEEERTLGDLSVDGTENGSLGNRR
jgi:hypothetical protein